MKKITFLLLILPILSFSQWTQVGSDIDGEIAGEQSGFPVSKSGDGNTVAIGARIHDSQKGTTRIYTYSGGTWGQVGSDIDGMDVNERSGTSVSLSSSGNTVAIGAYLHDGQKGTTRIYTNSGGTWIQVGGDIDGTNALENSGYSVSLSSDGNIVAIGAYNHDGGKGTARIYTNSGGTWNQVGSDIDGVDTSESFGFSVSLSSDGDTVAIGALGHDGNKGTTRVYTNSGGTWNQVGGDIDGEVAGDRSGDSVSLSGDGNIVAIGAYRHDGDKGTTRIYTYSGGTWNKVSSDIDGVDANDYSGASVSLSNDGNTVAIGAFLHDGNKGTTRVFSNPVLSIENNTFGSEFNLYPNPSFGLSKIQLGENYNEVSVNIFNVLGKQVAKQTYNNTNVIELNTQEFTTGIYFIKVQSGVKEATIKLVVN